MRQGERVVHPLKMKSAGTFFQYPLGFLLS